MAELVEKEELNTVLEYLKLHLPESVAVYFMVKRIISGYNPGFHVWKSKSTKEASYNVIVVSADRKVCKNPYYRQLVHTFCVDPSEIVDTLSHDGVLDFTDVIQFPFISEHEVTPVSSLMTSRKFNLQFKRPGFQYWCSDEKQVPNLPKVDGLTVSNLTLHELGAVIANWEFAVEGTDTAFREWINLNFPSVCVFDKDGNPVAWAMEKIWGDIGALFVKDSHRKKGLGKYVMAELARRKLQNKDYVYVWLDDGNDVSRKLHESVGYRKHDKTQFYRLVFTLE